MKDYENRKLTKTEIIGVIAAVLMFFGVGMIMGGSAAGDMPLFWSGVSVFAIGAGMALYLLFKHPSKEKSDF